MTAGVKPQLAPAVLERLRQAYREGRPVKELATRYGVSFLRVQALCADIPRAKPEKLKKYAPHLGSLL